MKMDLTQPTIKVENSKGVTYTGKITKFTFVGDGASINFKTNGGVFIMDIHVPDAAVPDVVNRVLNHRNEDVTITCMQNVNEDENISMTISDVGEKEEDKTPIYYSLTGTLDCVVTYEKNSINERALVTAKQGEISEESWMQFWVRPSIHTTPKDVYHLIRELEFIEKNNEGLGYPTFVFLYHKENEYFVLDGIHPTKNTTEIFTNRGLKITLYYKKDLNKLYEDCTIIPKDKYENNPIVGEIQGISYDALYDGSFVLKVYDRYGEAHTIYMTYKWNSFGKFFFDNLFRNSPKTDGKFAFFVRNVPTEEGDRYYLTGLYKI